jgi:hypothetical protein
MVNLGGRYRHCEARSAEAIQLFSAALDCFEEPVIERRYAPTRWLAMTEENLAASSRTASEAQPALNP